MPLSSVFQERLYKIVMSTSLISDFAVILAGQDIVHTPEASTCTA